MPAALTLPRCRLLIDAEPSSGAMNMSRDEALLDEVIAGGLPALRWYQWAAPTLSLGYFQQRDAVPDEWRGKNIDVVRRLTGGGAILHHHEWTYSCVVPALGSGLKHPYALYDVIHAAIVSWFADVGSVRLTFRGLTVHADREPFLCFARQDSHDVCLGTSKIVGSAQRRRKGTLLQHGSIVLRRSELAPDVLGLEDLLGRQFSAADGYALARRLALALSDTVDVADGSRGMPPALAGIVKSDSSQPRLDVAMVAWTDG